MKVEVVPLNEGYYTIGFDKVFHEFNKETDDIKSRPKGSLLVEIQPFLLKADGLNILFDTGLGFHQQTGELKIYEHLRSHFVKPEDITHVILSHLHKDHAGALNYLNAQGEIKVSFPNATYFVSKDEFEYAMSQGPTSYVTEDIAFLKAYEKVHWLDKSGEIENFISYEQDGGHCKHHTSFKIESEDQIYFFGGDNAPQRNQMQMRYVAKYDFDGKHALALREKYAKRAQEEHWKFLFYHDLKHPISSLEKKEATP